VPITVYKDRARDKGLLERLKEKKETILTILKRSILSSRPKDRGMRMIAQVIRKERRRESER
jgi:hypothetical protein